MHSIDDLIVCMGGFNEYVGRHIDTFDGVHRRYGISQRNLVRRMLLDICLEKNCLSNTWCKREKMEGYI